MIYANFTGVNFTTEGGEKCAAWWCSGYAAAPTCGNQGVWGQGRCPQVKQMFDLFFDYMFFWDFMVV